MSYCTCPQLPREQQEALLGAFLQNLTENKQVMSWNLLSISDMYNKMSDVLGLEDPVGDFKTFIATTIPFRGGPCPRSLKCCGTCTRQCNRRCVQDIFNRCYMWCSMVRTSIEMGAESEVPLNLMLLYNKIMHAEELHVADLSWTVGDIISRKTNTTLKEYMKNAGLRPEENPYKLEYGPQIETIQSPTSGRRIKKTSKETGMYQVIHWPASGLCPYCLPNISINERYAKLTD